MAGEIKQEDLKEFYDKGLLAYEKQNYDYAVELFSQLLSSKYDHAEARHYLHLSLRNKLKSQKPSFFSNIIHAAKRLLLTSVAEGMLKKGNTPGALEKLEEILCSNPSDTHALRKIADVFYQNGLDSHAVQNLEEAKAVNPNDIDVLKKLGELYLKKEDYNNARLNYEQALKINPNDTEALKSRKNLDALGTIQKEFKE